MDEFYKTLNIDFFYVFYRKIRKSITIYNIFNKGQRT